MPSNPPSFRSRLLLTIALVFLLVTQAPLAARDTGGPATDSTTEADAALVAALDAAFSATYPAGSPGAAILVRRGDTVLFERGYGSANLELDVPIASDSVFRIGSITKQFTAVAVLMLIDEGKLRFDQTLAEALPEYPGAHAEKVTIEHLLTHTSGIPSYTEDEDFWAKARLDHDHAEMYAYFADEPLEFEPGSQWKYNNSGYYLLGPILEEATGETYGELLRQRIFKPLGMSSTFVDQPGRLVTGRVEGYQPDSMGFRSAEPISMTCPGAAGAMISTVADLDRWNRALDGERLLPRALLERAWTPYRLSDGEATNYGYGWQIGTHLGTGGERHRVIEHGGGIHGFTSYGLRLPDDGVYVAVLQNGHPAPPVRAAKVAASLVLGENPDPPAVEVPTETLERYVGVYRIDDETTRIVTVEDGQLFTQRAGGARVAPRTISETELFYPDRLTRARFEIDAEGRVTGMTMTQWTGESEHAVATDEPIPEGPQAADVDLGVFDPFLGRYELAPGFVLEIRRDGDALVGQATGQGPVPLTPSSETEVFNDMIGLRIAFAPGDPPSLTLFQGGQEIPAERLPPER